MPDCIVIGGGVIGLLTARALWQAGMDVTVIERGCLGGESSWAGGGIVSPLYPWRYNDAINLLAEHSKQLYPDLVASLHSDSGIDCELLNSGMLYTDMDEWAAAEDWAKRWRHPVEVIESRSALEVIEPALHPDIRRAIWMPDVYQVRNPRLVQALHGSLLASGIHCLEHTEVIEILRSGGGVSGVCTARQSLHAKKVVVASGAWSANVMRGLANIAVQPVKGQMLMFKGEPGRVRTMVLSRGHYIIPRRDGHVLAGSTLENVGFDKQITAGARQTLSADACALVPELADMPIERHWSGLRPGTESGIPYICTHPEIEGLYIHAGHYRNGIVLGPASAQLMAEIVCGENTFCDASAYTIAADH